MTEYKSYDDLPASLDAKIITKFLGISRAKTYELLNRSDFPKLRFDKRIIVPKDKFIKWIDENSTPSFRG